MFVFKAAVVGAGPVGDEIATAIADAGIAVVSADEPDLASLVDVDFAIEVAGGDLETTQERLSELEDLTRSDAILATSGSELSVTELTEVLARPDRVVGLHFAGKRVVEVVQGELTSPETLQAASRFAQAIRKTPIRCADAPGLVVSRVAGAVAAEPDAPTERASLRALVESCLVLEEGVASAREIDVAVAGGAGIKPPPFAGADGLGLDQVLAALERAASDWHPSFEPPAILRRLVGQGRLGAAAGQGFFPYPRPDAGWEERPVKLESRGKLAIAWLDRPPANSVSPEVAGALRELWDAVLAKEVSSLVIASANPNLFCAGADIKAFAEMDARSCERFGAQVHELLREMERSPVVTIAAVNGLALGGGCELAMGCDLRIAAESASFGQPEIGLGIIPGFGGTQRLPRLIGTSKALEMTLTGDPISAEEAYALGLVTALVEDHEVFDTALAWARKLSAQAPLAVAAIKRVSAAGDLDAGLAAEQQAFGELFASADAKEGFGAFMQKREPKFTGR